MWLSVCNTSCVALHNPCLALQVAASCSRSLIGIYPGLGSQFGVEPDCLTEQGTHICLQRFQRPLCPCNISFRRSRSLIPKVPECSCVCTLMLVSQNNSDVTIWGPLTQPTTEAFAHNEITMRQPEHYFQNRIKNTHWLATRTLTANIRTLTAHNCLCVRLLQDMEQAWDCQ